MNNTFSTEDVQRIARLSSLELSEEETQTFAEQFSTILDYFELLKQANVSVEQIEPDESHLNGTRKDLAIESDVFPEQFSPYTKDGFFKVPRVIETGN